MVYILEVIRDDMAMTRIILPAILIVIFFSCDAQTGNRRIVRPFTPKVINSDFRLGDRLMQVKTFQYGSARKIICVNLHDDELTSVNSAKKLLEKEAGLLIKIENNRQRNIKFRLDGQYYTFDPNRMFSRQGISQSLTMFGRVSPKAISEIEKFAAHILGLIPESSWIIALHNNSNGKFSINSYLPGNIREKDAKELSVNPEEDPDDIFLTTDSTLFKRLADDKYNAIWQDNENAKRDGSLSIYCGERNIPYINCETEHGRYMQYQQMIMIAADHILGRKKSEESNDVIAYNYKLVSSHHSLSPKTNTEIMFGEKKVGFIRSVTTDSSWATVGRLEVHKDFPLYSNMDLLLIPSSESNPRFEVRIDPTKQKELLDPARTTVNIKAAR
jgi:hypothetical protein